VPGPETDQFLFVSHVRRVRGTADEGERGKEPDKRRRGPLTPPARQAALRGCNVMNPRKHTRDRILDEKCSVLADTIAAIRPVYAKATPRQRVLLETMIGAALWYIPKPSSAWTGRVSVGALRMFHPTSGIEKPRFSEEHVYPRKVAARLLLEDQSLDGTNLSALFREKYGRLHFISQTRTNPFSDINEWTCLQHPMTRM